MTEPRHLASLNLFREGDGSVRITCAGAPGAIVEMQLKGLTGVPADYVDQLIVEAASHLSRKDQ